MFSSLSERLAQTIKNLTGQGRLTEKNIGDTLRDVRMALLEADVALPVVKEFIDSLQQKALGQQVLQSLTPGDTLVKLVNDELTNILGKDSAPLNLQTQPPAVILVAGLQGSGKTTTVAKLANWLKQEHKKSVLVTSVDIYRPAAIAQLETLAKQIDVHYFPSSANENPVTIAKEAVAKAKIQFIDVVIIDSAGRLHIDQEMMNEIRQVHQAVDPIETLFVVDSMTGQDAANTAKAFNEALPLTGVVLTKTDGDARGGAALSIRQITGKPIKFIGVGEKVDALEMFHPERIASRILGMGDILSLVEEAQRKVDKVHAEKMEKKLKKGKSFDLEDFKNQLQQMRNMGGITSLLGKIPGMGQLPAAAKNSIDEKMFVKMEAIINSMTSKERRFPALIKGSHKRRISLGSGTEIQDINRLLKQFMQMQKMMKKLKGGGMVKMMQRLKNIMPGDLPM
ncbi:MAG: signal recognition particle protein [Gammaproteobacteria bacterium]|nr:signal recognition particle protein [Gammaproteobacteria bacterium]